jgi:hypothetical protein
MLLHLGGLLSRSLHPLEQPHSQLAVRQFAPAKAQRHLDLVALADELWIDRIFTS